MERGRELIKSYQYKDFDVDWFSGSGAGGQHRNKHQNCVRLTHIESGIVCVGQNSRSRKQNLHEAFKTMADRLVAKYHTKVKPRGTNEEVIRTYHEPDNRVKDHASNFVQTYSEVVGDGIIEEMILARMKAKISE